jgi:hypothetical protein
MRRGEFIRIRAKSAMRFIPDHCTRICFKVDGLSASLRDCAFQDVSKFAGMSLIIHISGNDNPAPESGVFFKYFWMNPDLRHGSLTLKIFKFAFALNYLY